MSKAVNARALLEQALPLARPLPHVTLTELPTPVQRLERASAAEGCELWVKRDDLSAPRYGGNKVRKLELLLAEAQQRGAASTLTVGGVGSNHILATAIYGQALDLAPHAIVFPQPMTPGVRRTVELYSALGVTLTALPTRLLIPLWVPLARQRAQRPCYLIAPGGSSPLGTLAYVAAGCELAAQVRAGALPEPREVWVALGSGGTAVGLQIGLGLAGLQSSVVAVRVVERWQLNSAVLAVLRQRTLALIAELCGGRAPRIAARPLRIVHGQLGGPYGTPTPAAQLAVARGRDDGLALDTTYSGKTYAALLRRRGRGPRLLWNTYNSRKTEVLDTSAFEARALPERVARWLAR